MSDPALTITRKIGATGSLYGVFLWIVFVLAVFAAIFFTIFVPGLERRRRWVTAAARSVFRCGGIGVSVHGLEQLPSGHCVVVANHASYIDGVILQAFLPPRFSYVIKGEMRNIPIVHFLLRRIGAKFVERFVTSGSARDARVLLKAASAGESLAFFPEGTFIEQPGLGRFRNGAFVAAIKGGIPIVPVVIRGSRYILPARHVLPCRGPLALDVLAPILPVDSDYSSPAKLAEAARQRILGVLDEPDLIVANGPQM